MKWSAEQAMTAMKVSDADKANAPVRTGQYPLYLSEGETEGVRGDIAFAQSCLETGNFTFSGSAVTLEQNNFCGLGVTQRGKTGLSFASPQLGIRAQVQHFKAYASTDALINERIDSRLRCISPRTGYGP